MITLLGSSIGFNTSPLPGGGYCWTLTTLLGAYIAELESRFGVRNRDYTILGIEFCGDIPGIWYPGNTQHVSIMLTEAASQEPRRAIYQLAHEAVHLLSPNGRAIVKVIEEGIAHNYANEVSDRLGLAMRDHRIPSYEHAARIYNDLIRIDPDAVKNIRFSVPEFDSWTPEVVQSIIPAVSSSLAQELCEQFER